MTFVLIFIFWQIPYDHADLRMQEFSSQNACEVAAKTIIYNFEQKSDTKPKWFCVPK